MGTCIKKMKYYILNFLIIVGFACQTYAQLPINLNTQSIQDRQMKYPVQAEFHQMVSETDWQDLYAVKMNYQYYNNEKKIEASDHIWHIKIHNLPLDQKAVLIFSLFASDAIKQKKKTLHLGNFLVKYEENYEHLSYKEKLNLIKFDLTQDTKYSTPEVQKFMRLRQNQVAPQASSKLDKLTNPINSLPELP